MTIDSIPEKQRWPRSHRFVLSSRGQAAETDYRSRITGSQQQGGRASLDAARNAWASEHQLQAEDGLYLMELAGGSITLPQLLKSLEASGQTKKEAIAALGRLDDAGMFDAA